MHDHYNSNYLHLDVNDCLCKAQLTFRKRPFSRTSGIPSGGLHRAGVLHHLLYWLKLEGMVGKRTYSRTGSGYRLNLQEWAKVDPISGAYGNLPRNVKIGVNWEWRQCGEKKAECWISYRLSCLHRFGVEREPRP
jgi:hypothetical protein